MVFIWKLKLLKGYVTKACVHSWALMALTSLFWGLHHSLPKRPLSAETWVFSPCLSYIIGIPHLSDVHPHQSCCLWLSMDLIDSGFLSWAWACLITTVLPNDRWTVSDSWLSSPTLILTPSCELTSWLALRFASSPWSWLMIWTRGWNLTIISGSALLALLRYSGTGPWLGRNLSSWPYDHALLSVPQGATSFRCSLTLCLVGIFFVVPKDRSSHCLRIFLPAVSASRAVQKSSV